MPSPAGRDVAAFRFTTGRLCLDLVATLTERRGQGAELLEIPGDLA